METNIINSPLFFPHANLEHTELLADVRQTVGLLYLVLDHVESHSLGERSTRHLSREYEPALADGHNITFLHGEAGRAVSGDVTMSLLITMP